MSGHHEPQEKQLLNALSPAARERLYSHLELVAMPLGKVLYESGDVLRHVYFPTDSIVLLLYVMEDGASAEIAVVETDVHPAGILSDVIDTIRDRLGHLGVRKVMCQNLSRLSLSAPFPAGILVVADQFFLLGVYRNDG